MSKERDSIPLIALALWQAFLDALRAEMTDDTRRVFISTLGEILPVGGQPRANSRIEAWLNAEILPSAPFAMVIMAQSIHAGLLSRDQIFSLFENPPPPPTI